MSLSRRSRREFLKASTAAVATTPLAPYLCPAADAVRPAKSPNSRLRMGAIGLRYQGSVDVLKALPHADLVAVCDVDRNVADQAKASFGSEAVIFEDYRKMLDRKDIDVVIIATPDHWHTAMLADAVRAGKDVYCEKPLTLTIDEGKFLTKVVADSKRVVQVGTWQRSDVNFRLAAELVRAGRLGKIKKVTAVAGKNPKGGPFKTAPIPPSLNWNLWQGQAPDVPYVPERCHYTFRWWTEYSGGKITDWGAHHLDIVQWALGAQHSGPVAVEGKAKYPTDPNGYNVATECEAKFTYADGTELYVLETGPIGITFEGEKGSLFVERGKLAGSAVDALKDAPLPREKFTLYAHDDPAAMPQTGKLGSLVSHMANFFSCVKSRQTATISDVASQHRSVSVCHLANIAMRLGRPLKWDPKEEAFVGDLEANGLLRRPQRKGFEIA